MRLKKIECSIPVQLQLASDEDFMTVIRPLTFRQVSYSEHTNSGIFWDPVSRNVEVSTGQRQGPVDHDRHNDSNVSRKDINRQILTQLTNTSSTAQKSDKKTSEKSSKLEKGLGMLKRLSQIQVRQQKNAGIDYASKVGHSPVRGLPRQLLPTLHLALHL